MVVFVEWVREASEELVGDTAAPRAGAGAGADTGARVVAVVFVFVVFIVVGGGGGGSVVMPVGGADCVMAAVRSFCARPRCGL